jgi:NhaC family Na+:H+ antiporter
MAIPDKEPKSLTWIEAVIPIAALIVLIGFSYYLFGDAGADGPIQVALGVAAMIAVFIAWRRGHTLDALREAAIASVGSGMGAIFILFGVGALIGTWP